MFEAARNLGDEIEFKNDGIIAKRARLVMDQAEKFLNEIKGKSLIQAIADGQFAGIKRTETGGKGLGGVFEKGNEYSNPILDALEQEGVIND